LEEKEGFSKIRVEKTISRGVKNMFFDSGVERKKDEQDRFGCKNSWVGFHYKMINEDDE
jgi:hypothetical protein